MVLGLLFALAGAAQATAAAPLGVINVIDQDDPTDTPPDAVTTDEPADAVTTDMPADDVTTDVPADDVTTDMPADAVEAAPTPTAAPTATPTVTPTATPTAVPTVNPAAIQQVIQHSADEQVQSIKTRNLSLTSDTVTTDQFQQLTKTLQDLLDHQVTAIALLKLDWGPISIAADGSGATATTFETWRVVSQAGSIDYDPVRNDYLLVLDNGTWKIKSDVQTMIPPQRTGNGPPPQ
jgi:hypothetical protein